MKGFVGVLLVALLLGLSAAVAEPNVGDKATVDADTSFTQILQPPYRSLSKKDLYEEREYEDGDYVATNVTGLPFTIAYTKALSRLYAYFLGRNEDNVRMSRTQPSFTRMHPNKEFTDVVDKNYTVSLWIPGDYQGKPPAPTVDEVKICRIPKQRGYAREFPGFATQGKALEEGLRLRDALLKDKIDDFDDKRLWLAVYDPPTKILHRRNEVLFDACKKGHHGNQHGTMMSKLRALYNALLG
ncbi:SOUL-domain-containing protein [Coccomyxa subellipsoidea C-169]|uniref:SOUL-domain-containing protein n=1 Tax=Coccomyxa subellipsoidea (strain C-169) TaxID=574566 RepID=I0YTF3_COCSC|nr:SOUL-domain-containing protein [Coccomyxa subellipsoidea C-169]EIE21672.1 SOUL-domain-containing protein [Coccomyxa subellipsoidea C-169]|eukprot:XP_005646216.1 SOUL-domain-containing protein [Coccomyxa subellipsoidea C-169]